MSPRPNAGLFPCDKQGNPQPAREHHRNQAVIHQSTTPLRAAREATRMDEEKSGVPSEQPVEQAMTAAPPPKKSAAPLAIVLILIIAIAVAAYVLVAEAQAGSLPHTCPRKSPSP